MGEQNKDWNKIDWNKRNSIEHFEGFLETFVVGQESYIRKENQGQKFGEDLIEEAYNSFCEKSKENTDKSVGTMRALSVNKKFDDVVKDFPNEYLEILNHAVFLWGLPNNRKPGWIKETKEEKNKGKSKTKENNPYRDMPTCSVGGGGSGYVQTKVKGIRFILYIFTQIFKAEGIDNIKNLIKTICLGSNTKDNDFPYGKDKEPLPDGVKNFLLHLCDKDNYEPIASTSDKKKIVKTFIGEADDIDEAIKDIKGNIISKTDSHKYNFTPKLEILIKLLGSQNDFSFYNDKISWLWRAESEGVNLCRVQLLEYKKAMVLYGPPGTGKTYTAMELAKEMLVRYWVKQYENLKKEEKEVAKEKLEDCINNIKKITEIKDLIEGNKIEEKNIYYLQLHVNYSYENFIAGQVIEDNKIVTKKGFIYDVIEKANNKKQEPFVVILDEMNRVDVSRVFGELFTAIEKRGTDVDLTLPKPPKDDDSSKESNNTEENDRLTLTIPENIYFIGTMNEIDFSLEQLDFALRRRFIWELADYDSDSLEQIITSRLNAKDDYKDGISSFIDCCDKINKAIENCSSLGEKYHIGHAFFAEVAEIINKLVESSKNKSEDTIWKNAKSILWQISILPTLEAYCGTMDSSEKKTFIEKCKASYEGKSE